MCGLCGFLSRQGSADEGRLARLKGTLLHRGPDGPGAHLEGGIALGHRRLIIIDLSKQGERVHEQGRGLARPEPSRWLVTEPLGHVDFDFVRLMSSAGIVLTDSGRVQEEMTLRGVPCVTLRKGTERPATIEVGTNVIGGTDPATISGDHPFPRDRPSRFLFPPPLAANRISAALDRFLIC